MSEPQEDKSGSDLLEAFISFNGIKHLNIFEKLNLRLCNKRIKCAVDATITSARRLAEEDALQRVVSCNWPLVRVEYRSHGKDYIPSFPQFFKMVLDDACRQLRFLESIRLDYAEHLGELPGSIGQLSRLHELCISAESFTLPPSFAQLTKLTCFWSNFRSERGTIEGLTPLLQLTNLKELSLAMTCPLKKTDLKLLEEFHRLALLEELCLDFPTIRKFPKFVVDLKSLRELILHCDCLNRLPENLTRLTALHRLQISRCSSLNVLPHNIGALKNLKELLLLDCKLLGGLPSSITELKGSLTRLYLSCLPWS